MGSDNPQQGTISNSPPLVFGKAQQVKKRLRKPKSKGDSLQAALFANANGKRATRRAPSLPPEDNTPGGLRALLEANRHYREAEWPEPYNRTKHELHLGDARNL